MRNATGDEQPTRIEKILVPLGRQPTAVRLVAVHSRRRAGHVAKAP